MKFNRIIVLLAFPLYFFSCSPQQKLPNYLENLNDTTGKRSLNIPELRIQKNDLLSIQVYSQSFDPKIDQDYNLPLTNAGTAVLQGQGASTAGFLVDLNGNIQHPKLGTFHVEGLTKQELAAEFRKRLTQPIELLNDPTIVIRFLNFQVTVMGEVAKPGAVLVPGERITILQAIGLSGDITQYGRKNTVKIIREIDNKREIGFIDLSSKDLFDSPYYHLVQNDMVIIEPGKIKQKTAEQAVVAQKVSFALTIATVAASIANIFIGRN